MPAKLLDEPQAIDRLASGMMKNVELHKAKEKVSR
jgi:hypothetical protein